MAQPTWTATGSIIENERPNRLKFFIAGGLILVAIVALVVQAISNEGQYFITVNEYYADPGKYADRDIRLGAWVDGNTISFNQIDAYTSRLEFEVVDDLTNPTSRMRIVVLNEPLPDLLQDHAQALVEGRVGADGDFYANPNGLLLKCPTRYEEGATASY